MYSALVKKLHLLRSLCVLPSRSSKQHTAPWIVDSLEIIQTAWKKEKLARALLSQKSVISLRDLDAASQSRSFEMKRCRRSTFAFRFRIGVVSSPFSQIFSRIILHTLNKPLASQSENIGRPMDEILSPILLWSICETDRPSRKLGDLRT